MDRENRPYGRQTTGHRKRTRRNRSQSSSASASGSASRSHSNDGPSNAGPSNADPSNQGPSNPGPSNPGFTMPSFSQLLQNAQKIRDAQTFTRPLNPPSFQALKDAAGLGRGAPHSRAPQPLSIGRSRPNQPTHFTSPSSTLQGPSQPPASSSPQGGVAGPPSQPRSRHSSGRPVAKDARREANASNQAGASSARATEQSNTREIATCPRCGNRVRRLALNSHECRLLECPFPNFSFSTYRNSSFHDHRRSVHEGVRVQCPDCQESFSNRNTLSRHRRVVHRGVRLQCQDCERSFRDRFSLNRHRDTHRGVQYDCPECGRSYARRENLDMHRESHTRGLIRCPDCRAIFSNTCALHQHRSSGCRHSSSRGGR